MASTVRAQEAFSSSCYYDVFLSFRGEDTRKTFTDHLYTALVQQEFCTFRDRDEIEMGEYLKLELEKANRQSKISIVVLSKGYASSTWCLDELVMILKQRRMNPKHVVMPVFYDVEPSQIRKQTGKTAEAFARYEKQLEEVTNSEGKTNLMEKIEGWRSALTEIANLTGLDLQNQEDGHEAKFIQKIVKVIGDKLRLKTLDVAPYKIGIDYRAKDINMWLQDGSTNDSVRAISGMGGIGKTTIAKFVYNQNYLCFDGSSFLANIREVSEEPNGLVRLQRQLLSDISRRKYGKINNVDEGLEQIKNVLYGKKVLLVLDDVERVDQIYVVLGMQDRIFPGSKVIITSRHGRLRLLKDHQIFRLARLGEEVSIKLFSLHAFGEDCPIESYTEHVKRVLRICDGLPLALKVVGSSLSGKSEDEWVCEIAKLEAIPHTEIHEKLKISYDSLQDDHDKSLFLHIACFFVGVDKDYTIKLLEKCDLHAKIGIQNLIDRCLLTIGHTNELQMHRLIQEMGREIIKQESRDAGERSRLWHHLDAFSVLKNETGAKAVEGLTLDMRMLKEAGNNSKKRRCDEFRDKSILLEHVSSVKRRCFSFIYRQPVSSTSSSPNDVCFRTNAFKNMTKLRLLQLNYVQLTGSYENFPKSLVWLSWHGFPLKSVPAEFLLENLVALDLHHSRLEQVWKKTPFLGSLKIFDLSYSERLERTPNFVRIPNLERLILKGCVSLVEICESIGDLEMLELLDLHDCKTLKKLPKNIGKLGSMKTLIISGCNIGEFPSEMRNIGDSNNADGIAVNPLHSSSGEVNWWQRIVCSTVSALRKGPESLLASLPWSLRDLKLSRCNLSEDSFPKNFGDLPSLVFLDLSGNPFCSLPNCIRSLRGLLILYINRCHRLQSLELIFLSKNSVVVCACSCRSLLRIMSPNKNVNVNLSGCYKLDFKRKFDVPEIINDLGIHKLTTNLEPAAYCAPSETCQSVPASIYIQGRAVPLFTSERTEGSSISFTMPSPLTSRFGGFNLYCTYGIIENGDAAFRGLCLTRVAADGRRIKMSLYFHNKSKNIRWRHTSHYFPVPRHKDDTLTWLTKLRYGKGIPDDVEAGDVIVITYDGVGIYEVKECGFEIVYHGDVDQEYQNGSSSTFGLSSGAYILSPLSREYPFESSMGSPPSAKPRGWKFTYKCCDPY